MTVFQTKYCNASDKYDANKLFSTQPLYLHAFYSKPLAQVFWQTKIIFVFCKTI